MNDQFLYANRPPVRKEFADNLYARLEKQSDKQYLPQKRFEIMRKRIFVMYILAALLVCFGVLYSINGDIRAALDQAFQTVAGFLVEERTVSPVIGDENPVPVTAAQIPTMEAQPTFTPYMVEIPSQAVKDVIQNPPFDFSLPAYVPDGFTLQSDAATAISKEWVMLGWGDQQHAEIEMLVEREYTGYALPVGVDSTEEIQVNGTPAILVKGGWNGEHVWQADYGMEIHWQVDGHYYRLIWNQRTPERNEITAITTDPDVVRSELIRMAESAK
jgi:hypothetical protein